MKRAPLVAIALLLLAATAAVCKVNRWVGSSSCSPVRSWMRPNRYTVARTDKCRVRAAAVVLAPASK